MCLLTVSDKFGQLENSEIGSNERYRCVDVPFDQNSDPDRLTSLREVHRDLYLTLAAFTQTQHFSLKTYEGKV